MRVYASIVTHCTPPVQLTTAIECILRCPGVACVYVVDNSPTTALKETAEALPRVKYIHVENRGYGAGHNTAIRESLATGADYHLVMNADVRWDGDALTPLIGYMEAHPEVGLIAPRAYYPDGTLQYTCRMLPTPMDLIAKRFLPKRFTSARMKRYLLAEADHSRAINCPYLIGCFMLLRTDALRQVGLFDERFFMYPEDIDLTRRIHGRYVTLYYPYVSIVHDHAAASRHSMKMLKIHTANMIRYFNKWGWISDIQRRLFNRTLRQTMPHHDGTELPGRG
ncbi:MAG: glycosyltransferase family 2 protein [Muribaculaceae bacterium]|nr:glycosyltransferase family 2 protein [Muribaculaceae bacterium]